MDSWKLLDNHPRFQIVKNIGKGTFAGIYLAKTLTKEGFKRQNVIIPAPEYVIIKMIPKRDFMPEELFCGLFLDHPHIVKMYDWMDLEGYYGLIFEHMEGGDWMDYMIARQAQDSNSSLSEDAIRPHLKQILSAIEYIHSMGVAHRDIKLDNILFQDKNLSTSKLADFGLSFIVKDSPLCNRIRSERTTLEKIISIKHCYTKLTEKNENCGSKQYIPPDSYMGNLRSFSSLISSDVYSFGVVLYILIYGSFPIQDTHHFHVMQLLSKYYSMRLIGKDVYTLESFQKQLTDIWRPRYEEASKAVIDLMGHLLHPLPEKRFTLEECKNHPWF